MGTKISEIANQIDSSNLRDAKFVVEDNLTTKYVTGSQLQSFVGAGGPHLYPMYRYKYEPNMSVATLNQFSTWLKANWENHGQQAPPGIYTWKFTRNHYGQSDRADGRDLTIDVTTQFPTEPIITETGNEASGGANVKGRGTLKYGLAYYQGKLFILVATTSSGKGREYDGSGPRWLTYLPADTNPNPGIGALDVVARVAITGTEMVDKPTNYNVTGVTVGSKVTGSGSRKSYSRNFTITFQNPVPFQTTTSSGQNFNHVNWFILNGRSEDNFTWSASVAEDGKSLIIAGTGGYKRSTAGGGFAGITYPNFGMGAELVFVR